MDDAERKRREELKAKADWARRGSLTGAPGLARGPTPVAWGKPDSWVPSTSRHVFLAEAVRRIAEQAGSDAVADPEARASAWSRLLDALREGVVRAYWRDEDGEHASIREGFWLGPSADGAIRTCRLGHDGWLVVAGEDVERLLGVTSLRPPVLAASVPASSEPSWWMKPGEKQSSWFLRPEVREEGARRQQGASRKALARAFVDMAAECRRELNLDSLESAMRQSEQFPKTSRTRTRTSRT